MGPLINKIFTIPVELLQQIYGVPRATVQKMYQVDLESLSSSSSSSSTSSSSSSRSSSSSSSSTVTMDWDTDPDTINLGGNVTFVVQNGRAPFTWSITTGAGYSLDGSTDDDNVLTHTGGAVCGAGNTPYVVIQVVDDIGTTITKKVRNVGVGTWESLAGWGRSAICDQPINCAGNTCAVQGVWTTTYKDGTVYPMKWEVLVLPGCVSPQYPDFPRTQNSPPCGSSTVSAAEVGLTGSMCDCSGAVSAWTCGADCP